MIEKGGDFKEVIIRTHPSVNEFENGGSIMSSKRVIKLLYFVRLFICYFANKSFPLFPPLLARCRPSWGAALNDHLSTGHQCFLWLKNDKLYYNFVVDALVSNDIVRFTKSQTLFSVRRDDESKNKENCKSSTKGKVFEGGKSSYGVSVRSRFKVISISGSRLINCVKQLQFPK